MSSASSRVPVLDCFVITAPFFVHVAVLCPLPAVAVHGAIQVRISEENSTTVAGSVNAMAGLMSARSLLLFPGGKLFALILLQMKSHLLHYLCLESV